MCKRDSILWSPVSYLTPLLGLGGYWSFYVGSFSDICSLSVPDHLLDLVPFVRDPHYGVPRVYRSIKLVFVSWFSDFLSIL